MQSVADKKEDDHEQRLRNLENKQNFWSGGIAVVGFLMGGVIEWFFTKK